MQLRSSCHRATRAGLSGRGGQGAFTLLELLLATAVGAIVLLVINGTFFGALRLHNATHDKIGDNLAIQRTLSIVRRDLAGIMIPANPAATTNTFSGQLTSDVTSTNDLDNTSERVTPDITTNSGRIDGWTPYAEVQMVSYYLSPAADGGPAKDLVRVVTRNLLPAAETTTENQTLLAGVISAGIAYFDGQDWLDTWDSTTTRSLPTAIKFSLVVAPRGGTSARTDLAPIELVVPVLVKTTTTLQQEAAAEAAPL
ncbi:MAG: prepilin-type N-terminal cleavage/methylation domain-containing protein [Verrucomicrobia bacterium]|nr:prepilin-type N-terminal cleavage/methylation domain-containing protein [Verrucomicrobiota bacterium]